MKRYTCQGNRTINASVVLRYAEGLEHHGTVRRSNNKWFYRPGRAHKFTRVAVEVLGLGNNGIILCIIHQSYLIIGELVTHELTGRTIYWSCWNSVHLYEHPAVPPMATRIQAMQIFASKWFSERRST